MKNHFRSVKISLSLLAVVATAHAGLFSKKMVAPAAPTNPPPPVVVVEPPPVVVTPPPPATLGWDAEVKEAHPEIGQATAETTFWLTNTSTVDAVISSVTTSCGCTTAHLPPMPWTLTPGASGKIDVSMNLAGKTGTVVKSITVNSTAGTKALQFRVVMPDPQVARDRNMMEATADRQAIFHGTCANCHVTPGVGKTGAELYNASCGICHEAQHRASAVADLHNLQHPTDRDFWKTWVTYGKPHSMMAAFAQSQGGPLTPEQVDSLADFLVTAFPSRIKTATE
ncbi:MAG: hypothetical protein RLZZ350_1008 [Verrucomicrobiota bacterium]